MAELEIYGLPGAFDGPARDLLPVRPQEFVCGSWKFKALNSDGFETVDWRLAEGQVQQLSRIMELRHLGHRFLRSFMPASSGRMGGILERARDPAVEVLSPVEAETFKRHAAVFTDKVLQTLLQPLPFKANARLVVPSTDCMSFGPHHYGFDAVLCKRELYIGQIKAMSEEAKLPLALILQEGGILA